MSLWPLLVTLTCFYAIVLARRYLEGDVRLIGGSRRYMGTVVIFHDGKWGAICDSQWDKQDATVVCRQLGYSRVVKTSIRSEFGMGTKRMWLSGVQCHGDELRLSDCLSRGFNSSTRDHCPGRARSAGVICSAAIIKSQKSSGAAKPTLDKSNTSGKRRQILNSTSSEMSVFPIPKLSYNDSDLNSTDGVTEIASIRAPLISEYLNNGSEKNYSVTHKNSNVQNIVNKNVSIDSQKQNISIASFKQNKSMINLHQNNDTLDKNVSINTLKPNVSIDILKPKLPIDTFKPNVTYTFREKLLIEKQNVSIATLNSNISIDTKEYNISIDTLKSNMSTETLKKNVSINTLKSSKSSEMLRHDVSLDTHQSKLSMDLPQTDNLHLLEKTINDNYLLAADAPHEKPNLELRLQGGRYKWEGHLQVRIKDEPWMTICADFWTLREAMVACHQLKDFGKGKQALLTNFFGGTDIIKGYYRIKCLGNESTLDECHVTKSDNTHVCSKKTSVAGVVCSNYLPDLVPNLRALEDSVRLQDQPLYYLRCSMEENCLSDSAYVVYNTSSAWRSHLRRLLRFSTVVHNRGLADFKPYLPRGQWQWHACHMHYHSMEIFAHYDIIDRNGTRLAQGSKASFCLEDSACDQGVHPQFNCKGYAEQGLSVNCSDNYLFDIDCQWIDITDIKPD
ncbi:lysyl oxidase homolog 2-like isoform X2 [Biomphalaria glabrata]|uniref:protein-lysine 6-oxidase n=1 Tax=Biomphalaria glabrata TaxID=6526 RepID=A0A9W3BAW4_BIOGL|nr:lysyl oxidase homolog 2-like isoform X2 [Biomphalaria glabrata]